MDEAVAFIHSLPQKIKEKITYNYLKVANGVLDSQLFKKLENDILNLKINRYGRNETYSAC